MPSPNTTREYAQLIGVMSGFMAYGIHFTLFVITAHLLIARRKVMRRAPFFLAYICVQFALSSVGLWRDIVAEAASYVEHGKGLDDPIKYYNEGYRAPPEWVSVFVYAICTWLQDGLLLYRCFFLYAGSKSVIALPAGVFLASVGTSIAFIRQVSMSLDLYDRKSVALGILYWGLSVSFNVIVTLFILCRLYNLRRRVLETGSSGTATVYTSVATMVVESAALYSITGLIFIICYSQNNPAQYAFLTWLGQTESISPLLIILRVAQGRALSLDTRPSDTLPTIRFTTGTSPRNTTIRLRELPSSGAESRAADASQLDLETPTNGRDETSPVSPAAEWHRLTVKTVYV
ncbi:hypothetical protein NEOLEDRAFT_541401 [Neolentinus lepideus HHB14362 ss-1]|uniref:Uncharacterized protein n=1 Tax=Neolentinus lepideus HHB14362 ss-1 TaxID=1314782 RepID=A0A165RC64_9AGAM|nr:hypothetical protein NEOLEDRAFT_541401 [Neolentinus lepideus HHB14362 ss-1]